MCLQIKEKTFNLNDTGTTWQEYLSYSQKMFLSLVMAILMLFINVLILTNITKLRSLHVINVCYVSINVKDQTDIGKMKKIYLLITYYSGVNI